MYSVLIHHNLSKEQIKLDYQLDSIRNRQNLPKSTTTITVDFRPRSITFKGLKFIGPLWHESNQVEKLEKRNPEDPTELTQVNIPGNRLLLFFKQTLTDYFTTFIVRYFSLHFNQILIFDVLGFFHIRIIYCQPCCIWTKLSQNLNEF